MLANFQLYHEHAVHWEEQACEEQTQHPTSGAHREEQVLADRGAGAEHQIRGYSKGEVSDRGTCSS